MSDTSFSGLSLLTAPGRVMTVIVRHGDLLDPVPGSVGLIVANLPYLPASAAAHYPDLAGEPNVAVFADGDGLEPYRRLIDAAAERLTADGAIAIQLHRRILTAERDELDTLRVALTTNGPAWSYDRRVPAVAAAAA